MQVISSRIVQLPFITNIIYKDEKYEQSQKATQEEGRVLKLSLVFDFHASVFKEGSI